MAAAEGAPDTAGAEGTTLDDALEGALEDALEDALEGALAAGPST